MIKAGGEVGVAKDGRQLSLVGGWSEARGEGGAILPKGVGSF
jgi:hypothetical protein